MVDYKDYDKLSYHAGFQDGYAEAKEIFKRPQGEWINDCYMEGNFYHTCNQCNMEIVKTAFENYCPNCGADMRGALDNGT